MSRTESVPAGERDLLAVFRRETEERLTEAEAALVDLERDPADRDARRTLFRALHSLKGNAAVVGRRDLETFTHQLETVLHPIREGQRLLDRTVTDRLFPLVYALRDAALLSAALPGEDVLAGLAGDVERAPVAEARSNVFRVVLQYPGEPTAAALDPGFVLQDLADQGELSAVRIEPESILPLERLENPEALFLRYLVDLRTPRSIDEVREACFLFEEALRVRIEPVREVAAPTASGRNGGQVTTLRIEATRLDRLMNLTSELATTTAKLRHAVAGGRSIDAAVEVVDEIEGHCQAMQDEILSARMISIDELFRPFVRLVRELSAALGKRVALSVEGRDVDLDKALVEHMRDPLTHLVRNAIDHGLEGPEERQQAGKPPEGQLLIAASQREGSIYLVVHDDGRGLDRARIREQAVARGVVAADTVLTDAQLDALIFESGLSTAEKVTNVSGRGVGMDIVRKSIEHVHGEIRVASEPGRGCTFHIRLPLTLAIIEGFLAGVGDETFVVPVHAVTECFDLPDESGRHETLGLLNLRGTPLPYVRLRDRFALGGAPGGRERVVVVQHEGARVGLVVDRLLGESQTVIKSLGRFLGHLQSVSGATILWNGRVALILDVPGLLRDVAGDIRLVAQG